MAKIEFSKVAVRLEISAHKYNEDIREEQRITDESTCKISN
jgi:hypothetical protein